MRINILGGGPAGLYFAYLMKTSFPSYDVQVVEQNPRGVTFGFGVVLSGRAMEFISEGDGGIVSRLGKRTQSWSEQHIVHRGQTIVVDGSEFSGVARIDLLSELQAMCAGAGVAMTFGERTAAGMLRSNGLGQCDVVVGADGANSILRDSHADAFGTRVIDLQNYFAWYAVQRAYPAHTLTFKQNADGIFCAHHYRYKPDMSTFVAEVDDVTWQRSGMYAMDDDQRRRYVETVFADTLGNQPLISNRSVWRRWRLVKNDRWSFRNMVLIGDALRTAHPSIGSGTRLAMEDAIALWRAFVAGGTDVQAAFARYERERKPIRDRLNKAAELSISWYERLDEKIDLEPYQFANDYLLRTGVMTPERLERTSPGFMSRFREARRMGTA
jgi:2-polyprenyl-6-methoxyphenol hydroxylase-like FAD-dependent oxidoreductase